MNRIVSNTARTGIAALWIVNGVWCKLLHGVPRHEAIVARFFGGSASYSVTVCIGSAELLLGLAVLMNYRPRPIGWLQIMLILLMNSLEAIFARDLLLFGAFNFLLALLLCTIVFFVQCYPKSDPHGAYA